MLSPSLLAALVTLGAPPAPATPLTTPSSEDAIYGGVEVADGDWPEVVAIEVGDFLCTGTVVTEELVLTAAHCLVKNPPAGSVRVYFGNNMFSSALSTVATDYGVHPAFCGDTTVCKEDIHDYAWIRLRERVTGISFPRVMGLQDEWDQAMYPGSEVTLVGYGLDEVQRIGRKRAVTTTISAFSDSSLEFRAGGEGKDSCQGDSGGPAFVRLDNNEYVLAGVLSRGYDCGLGGFYGVPYPVLCWIEEESGINLKRDECGACDCLEMDPERHDKASCAVTRPRGPQGDALALLAVFACGLLGRRRRRLSDMSL